MTDESILGTFSFNNRGLLDRLVEECNSEEYCESVSLGDETGFTSSTEDENDMISNHSYITILKTEFLHHLQLPHLHQTSTQVYFDYNITNIYPNADLHITSTITTTQTTTQTTLKQQQHKLLLKQQPHHQLSQTTQINVINIINGSLDLPLYYNNC